MDPEDARKWAERLAQAAETRMPVEPITSQLPDLTVSDAYAIQTEWARLKGAAGDSVVGYKLGITSKPMQELIGVNEPDYAPVFASGVFDDGQAVDAANFIQLKVEGEISLVLNRDLAGPGVTAAQAARAISGAVASIEIVDSRIADWKIKLPDTIADMASSGATILSSRLIPIEDFDVRLVGMVISKNGELMGTGAGAAALGNPIEAVAWLANTLAPYGVTLEADRFIMTGALHAAFEAHAGDVVRAEFDRLGSVTLRMT